MPPTWQDLTKGLFYNGDLVEGEVGSEPKFVSGQIMLVTGSQGAM